MEVLTSAVEKVANYIFVPIGRQASYMIFYKGNFKMLEVHVKDLEAARERMIHSVEEEKGNGKEIETDVLNWMEMVNEVIEKANQLQEDPRRANVRCSTWLFPNLILRHQLSRKATKITKDVVQVQEKGTFDRIGYRPTLDGLAFSSSTTGVENHETRESLKEEIVKALSDHNLCNIGVYGLGGVGKTTLVEEVAKTAKQNQLFDKVVITHVSKNPNFKTIQGEIADFLGLRFDEETVAGRAHRLRQRIKMEKNILVILDDIWTILDLKKMGIPIGNEHSGCKLLMTSRNQDVLVQMDVPKGFTFRLEIMTEKETWSLFQFMAGDVVKDSNLKYLATQVAQKCAGLPLRVVTVARAMKNKRDVQSWKNALTQLQSNDNVGMDALTYSALELSYNSLESDEMRAIFLIFALLLGHDVEYFLKVAMGLDILKHTSSMDDARNILYTIIESLKATCLLREGKTSERIQMHDFVRDVAISIAHRDKNVFIRKRLDEEWPTKDFLKMCTQIVLDDCYIHELPQMICCPNIKLFYLCSENHSLKIPDTFFEGMESLRVLDLTCLILPSLPTSFHFLTGLQMLCLDCCILENMDEIVSLQNLEILRLWNSSMIKLPKEIGKLTQLRMLDLSNSGIEVVPPNIISSLTRLEELYMGNTSINWEGGNSAVQNENASIAELQKLPKLTTLELQIRETWMLPRNLQLMFEKLERYKIAIGDVWEWEDIEDSTLKTLMLKLGTNIHLEHGVKALIKGVENLYLDDVDGIQNVLYQLNGEGFPLLKHLLVQNNANMKHIVDSKERNQIHVSFPILETLVLHNLKNLEHICHGPLSITSFGSLSVIKVKNCVQLKYLFSYTIVKGLSHLSKIKVCHCNYMKEIVLEDNNSNANNNIITNETIEFLPLRSLTLEHLQTLDNFFSYYLMSSGSKQKSRGIQSCISTPFFFSAQLAFPNLETLKLSSLSLNKIWDDKHLSMYNLTTLIVENCGGLKYLFSSTVIGSFKNLKHLEISNCPLMEEIIAKEERNNASEEVHFLKLEKIILKDMDNLKTIWHSQFESVKILRVNNCNKIVVVFPSSMQKTYNMLQLLEVTYCAFVEEIFELTFNENSSVEDTSHLQEVIIDELPKLKKIWSVDPQGILSFENLIYVQLNSCGSLEYVLPLSIATHCSHLKKLHIKGCWSMKEITAEEKESRVCEAPVFEFNELNTLILWNLRSLKGFYVGKHTLSCPSLRRIEVLGCVKLNLFRTLTTSSSKSSFPYDKLSVITQQPPFIIEEVIPNMEWLRLDQKDADMIFQVQNSSSLFTKMTLFGLGSYNNEEVTFPYWFIKNVHTLETLMVEGSSFKKIFQDEGQICEKTRTRIKKMMLNRLHNLQHICEEGSQVDSILEFLENLDVCSCSSLTNLFPSSVTLNHLNYLEISNCNGLQNLITTHTAQSLVKLTTLKVKDCKSLEEIITGGENVGVAFIRLEILMLECLPRLAKFCSSKCFLKFPMLEQVIVRECPSMKVFSEGNTSTPTLRKVKIAENDEQWFWKTNINDTINKMFEDKVAFGSFKLLELSEYPELKELWYGQLQLHNVFRSLKNLVVHKCDFLSEVLFQPSLLELLMNLEELDIKDCNSLEAIFDLKGDFSKEILVKNSTQLKKLKLSNLPKLKHIWKEDTRYTMRFQNLSEVSVDECKSLISLFPLSIARDLMQLQSLVVIKCGIEEIVAKEVTNEMVKFEFSHLTSIQLNCLLKLKAFFVGVHSLQCKSLKKIHMFGCPKIELFKKEPLSYQESARNKELNISMYQPLFVIKEVLANVENLTLNDKDFDMILESQISGVQFNKVKHIVVCEFYNEKASFPYWLLENVPSLETLMVQWSSFKEIFKGEQLIRTEMETQIFHPQLRELKLWYLHKLQCICKEGFQMDPVLQFLESIIVCHCSSLIKLVPASFTFSYLTYLEVTNCNGLINLITYSTAKSLVKLITMKIKECNWLEDIVDGNNDETNEIEFFSLQSLELISLPRLRLFCSCPWPIKFPLLEVVVVKECPRMEYFSLGETNTPNLQNVKIEEENHWAGDINGTVKKLFDDKVAFGSFKLLNLSEYPELKELWYGQLQLHNLFRSLKFLVVHKCDFLSEVLFQPNLLEVLMNLEELDIKDCNSLEAIFDLKGDFSKEILVKNSTQLKKLKLSNLPKLKHIWKEDTHYTMRFQNLSEVSVDECESLISLFPLSIARDLMQLESLVVFKCGIEEIVAKEEGINGIVKFEFSHLTSIVLNHLNKLQAFFVGVHSLQCKSLKMINMFGCPKIELFQTKPMRYQKSVRNNELNISMHQGLFEVKEVIANVVRLTLNDKDFAMILESQNLGVQFKKVKHIDVCQFYNEEASFPYRLLENVPSLETLMVQWSSFKEIFKGEQLLKTEMETQIFHPQLRKLSLWHLHKLQCICKEGFQMDPVLRFLESIIVCHCSSLIKLVPASFTFSYLTYLEVTNCNGLINLITYSTAKSLVKLTTMKIKECKWLEDIVEGNKDETNEIEFISLQSLQLISLPRLRLFCSCPCPIKFPLLEVVVVKECPRMEHFSLGETNTPNLQNVKIEEENEENHWEGDINGTVKKLFDDKVAFSKFKYLILSDYPELKDFWLGQIHYKVFCNLKSLVVQRCDFLSHVLLPSNILEVLHGLEDLQVRDCDSLEAVFDVNGMKSKEIVIKQRTQLKSLTLSCLPNLKHIWNDDPYEIISFENLCTVNVSLCQNLLYIFPYSLCQDLQLLENLVIVSCGVEEIVAVEEGSTTDIFNFPQLNRIVLVSLKNLRGFCHKNHTLECPSLKILDVYCCEALKMFSFNHLDSQQLDLPSGQALFSIEMLSPNMEQLALNGTDALVILSEYCCPENIFHKIKFLRLQCFNKTPTNFLNNFHTIFPYLETFQVRNSSFETLFSTEEITGYLSMQISNQIRKLLLFELQKLEYIWQEDFPLDHSLIQDLEVLSVMNCPSLISFVPSSASFTNLTSLEVDHCKELVYLITSSTAKSLIQLTTLKIKSCEKMLDVVKIDDEKIEESVMFKNLEYLEMISLSSLRSFCYGKQTFLFPSLLDLIVKGCPRMKIFTSGVTVAPYLTRIKVAEQKTQWIKVDLNTTIEQLFLEQEQASVS